jgi:hypothetical protein
VKTHRKRQSAAPALALVDPEAMIQQLGQGVMNELAKVVDTVSTDLKLVTEQLKNLSTSMSESMMMTSMLKDQDLSASINHSFIQGQGQGRGGTVSPAHGPLATPERQKKGFGGRYANAVELSMSDDSHLLPLPPTEPPDLSNHGDAVTVTSATDERVSEGVDDHVLAEMIREGLKQKLLELVSQNMTLSSR